MIESIVMWWSCGHLEFLHASMRDRLSGLETVKKTISVWGRYWDAH